MAGTPAGLAATSTSFGGGGSVLATKNIPYTTIQPNVEILQPIDTTVEAAMKSTTGKSFAGNETPFQKSSVFDPIKLNDKSKLIDSEYVNYGNHTLNHYVLSTLSYEQQLSEIETNQKFLNK